MDKTALRRRLSDARAALPADAWAQRSLAVQQALIADPIFQDAEVIALYMPMGREVDTALLESTARTAGKRVAHPKLSDDGLSTGFVVAAPASTWIVGPRGFQIPSSHTPVALDALELIVLPGLGFDRLGNRLGRGAGHYDRALAQPHHARRVGLAFDFQLVDALPQDPWDVRLDAIATESGMIRAPEAPGR